jgi:uncharacterized protein
MRVKSKGPGRRAGYSISSTAVFLADGDPAKLDYHISYEKNWCSRSATIHGWIGTDARSWELARSSEGCWTVKGERVPLLDGLTDVDLVFTPATNTVALNRLRTENDSVAETSAVWLDLDGWSFKPLLQMYRRLSDNAFAYTSPLHDYHAELVVDDAGLLGHGPRGVTQRHVHLDAALVIAAHQVSAEIARLLDGGEVLSMKDAKRLRFAKRTRLLEDA